MSTTDFSEHEEFARDWYESGRSSIPSFPSDEFASFAGRSTGIIYTVSNSSRKLSLKIDPKAQSAAINGKEGIVILPGFYFMREFYEKIAPTHEDTAALAIATINGSLTHEALHERFSPQTLVELLNLTSEGQTAYRVYGDLALHAANLVEDLYIEAMGRKLFKAYSKFVEAKNAVLLGAEALEQAASEYDENPSLQTAIELAVAYKNLDNRDSELFNKLPEGAMFVLEIVGGTTSVLTQENRSRKVLDFCKHFEKPETVEREEEGGSGFGGSEIEKLIAAALIELIESDPELKAEILAMIEEAETEATEAIKIARTDRVEALGTNFAKPKVLPVSKAHGGDSSFHTPKADFGFVHTLQALRTKNRVPGEALTRGAHIVNTRLNRIATDGKIFSRNNASLEMPTRLEIITLVDASGSMGGYLFNNALSTSYGIHMALRKAGIANSVFFQTSYEDSSCPFGHQPVLYDAAQYDMERTDGKPEEKFEQAENIRLYENYDGLVIKEVSTHFTKRPGLKVIIVLSDGVPCGPGYHGPSADEHTQNVVKELRKKGYMVICLSLVDHVVEANNNIYGKDHNVDASKGLKKEFERVIITLQKEVK